MAQIQVVRTSSTWI